MSHRSEAFGHAPAPNGGEPERKDKLLPIEDIRRHTSAQEEVPGMVRPIEHGDRGDWLALWQGYNAFYDRHVPDAVTQATWERLLDRGEPMHARVFVEADRVQGIVQYLFHRSTSSIERVCYLQDLFTTPAARSRGVGRRLIEAVYADARAAGSPSVYWLTHETNHTARLLYDTLARQSGFLVYRRSMGER